MIPTSSSKSNIFFFLLYFVNVIWQIITMVLTSKQRERMVLDLTKKWKTIKEIAKEAKMSFRDIGYILKQAGKQEEHTQMQSISSLSYKLFSDGKTVLQVGIALILVMKYPHFIQNIVI
jgi:predicted transcriptional regulator